MSRKQVNEATASNPRKKLKQSAPREIKQLNTRFLIGLGVVFMLTAVTVYFLHDYQVDRNSEVLKENAKIALEEGDSEKAIRLLGQYIRLDPDDLDALAWLGELMSQSPPSIQAWSRAITIYSKILRESPDRPDAPLIRYRLVQLLTRLREFQQAETHLAKLHQSLDQMQKQDSTEALPFDRAKLFFLRGQCQLGLERPEDAFACFLAAMQTNAQFADYSSATIGLALRLGDQLPTINMIKSQFKQEPFDDVTLPEQLLAQLPNETGNEGNIKTIDREKISQILLREEILQTAAQPLIDYILHEMVKKVEPKYQAHMARAQYFQNSGNKSQADQELAIAQSLAPEDSDVRLMTVQFLLDDAELLAQQLKLEEAQAEIQHATEVAQAGRKAEPFNIRFDLALTNSVLKRHQFAKNNFEKTSAILEAEKLLLEALDRLPQAREAALKLDEKEKGDREYFYLNQLEVELRVQLVDVQLSLLESEKVKQEKVAATLASIKTLTSELDDLTRSEGLIIYLNARRQYIAMLPETSLKKSPETGSEVSWGTLISQLRRARLLLTEEKIYRRKLDLMLARCYQELENPEGVLDVFQNAYRDDSTWRIGRWELARALERAGRNEQASQMHHNLLNEFDLQASLVSKIELEMRQQLSLPEEQRDWSPLRDQIDKLLEQDPANIKIAILDTEIKTQQRNYEAAQETLQSLLDREDVTPEQKTNLWMTLIRFQLLRQDAMPQERLEKARHVLGSAKEAMKLQAADWAIAELMIAQSDSNDALEQAAAKIESELETFPPDHRVKVLESLATAFARLENREQEQLVLQKLSKLSPNHLNYYLRLANLAIQENEERAFQSALIEIHRIEGPNGPNGNVAEATRLISQLAGIGLDEGVTLSDETRSEYFARINTLLERAAEARPGWARVPSLLGETRGLMNDRQGQYEAFRRAIDLGATETRLYEVVASYLQQEERHTEAIRLLNGLKNRLNSEYPATLSSQLAQSHLSQDNTAQAFSIVRENLSKTGKGNDSFARAMIDMMEYEALLKENLAEEKSEDLQRLIVSAEKYFNEAIEQAPERADVWVGIVAFYAKVAELEKAKSKIELAEQKHIAESPEQKLLTLARCHEVVGANDTASKLYAKALEKNSDNLSVLTQVAEFFRRTQTRELELELLKKIETIAETANPEIADRSRNRRLLLEGLQGNTYKSARASIQKLEKILPEAGESRLQNLATQSQILSRFRVYEMQLKLIEVLHQIDRLKPLNLADRQMLVQLYFQTHQVEKARELTETLQNDSPNNTLLLASLIELAIEREQFDQAEQILSRLTSLISSSDAINVSAFTARLSHAKGETAAATEGLLTYLESLQEKTTPLSIFEETIANQNANLAFNWLAAVPKIGETDHARRINKGIQLIRAEQLNNALKTLTPVFELPEVQKFIFLRRIRSVQSLLIRFEQFAQAEAIYYKHLKVENADHDLAILISIIGQQGRIEETLALCEKHRQRLGNEVALSNSVALLRTSNHSAADDQRVLALIETSLKEKPEDSSVLRHLADYLDFNQKYDEAEQVYLNLIAQNPNNLIALNNLSWLLSMRNPTPARIEQANNLIDHAINLMGPSAQLLDTKATVLLTNKKYQEAAQLFERSILAAPDASKYLLLSQAQLNLNQPAKARDSFVKAMENDLDSAKLHPLLRKILEKTKQSLTARR